MDEHDALPQTAEGLTAGERLLLWSFRAWVTDPRMHALVWREFARIFPPDEASLALRALEVSIGTIARHARREIVHHPICCTRIAPDERAVMSIFAAAQAEQTTIAIRHADWLVRPSGAGALVAAASALALAMIENDLMLPYRGHAVGAPALMPDRGRMPAMERRH